MLKGEFGNEKGTMEDTFAFYTYTDVYIDKFISRRGKVKSKTEKI